MSFPASELKFESGEMFCHIFENKQLGIERGLFWAISVKFAPICYDDSDLDCSMACEWIPWNESSWPKLDGKTLDVEYGEKGIESSFYMGRHDTGTRTSISLRHVAGADFHIKMSMAVDFSGYVGGDENPDMQVSAEGDISFKGLIVVPDNLFPKPVTSEDVQRLAGEYVDLDVYGQPVNEGFRYRLPPFAS